MNNTPGFVSKKPQWRGAERKSKTGGWKKAKNDESKRMLTKEEEAEYRAQDRCFRCGEVGHMSHNCPQGKTATSSAPGKPPGIKSYSVKLDLRDAEQLREEALGDTTEGVYVGMISSCDELVGELFEEGSTVNSGE
ncbi:hypothetical protein C0995_015565, partial [Termitomyces sp. Mi166